MASDGDKEEFKESLTWSHPKLPGGLSLSVQVESLGSELTIDIGTGVNTSGPTLRCRITEDNKVWYQLDFHDVETDEMTMIGGDIFEPADGNGKRRCFVGCDWYQNCEGCQPQRKEHRA